MADRILFIDDDIDTLKLVGLMLERQGYEIAVASDGMSGLTKAATELPDLILLDVMMPDLDGLEVTRRLRADPALAHIPIIMFTAKTMVDDKVAGFEAGVDDYLTKPTHPAELTAHVKAVLARSAQARSVGAEKANIIALLGSRGGIGTTTLALNISIILQGSGHEVILTEFNPGRGTLALELNIHNPQGLSNLLARSLKDIHLRSVESEIISHSVGIRVLPASFQPKETELEQAVPQMEAILNSLASMCTTLILDLGSGLRPYIKPILRQCDRLILVVEPVFPSNIMGLTLLEELETDGISRHKINLALINRVRTSLQIPWRQVETDLGVELIGIVSPAPEQAHQASQGGMPIILSHPDSLVSDQLSKLAQGVAVYLRSEEG
ncbi:MAG: response regulator [Anaerolineales bacterium]|nr:MAG: response regulator [Anaerolineales bacterium]